jgi:hypothetical protein
MYILDNEETLLVPSIWHQTVIWIHIEKGMVPFFYLYNKWTVNKYSEEFEDIKGFTIHKPDEDKQRKRQTEKDKQRSITHHTEHYRTS